MVRLIASRNSRILFSALVVWLVLGAVQASIIIGLGSSSTPWWMVTLLQSLHALAWAAITLGVRWWVSLLKDRSRVMSVAGHLAALVVASIIDSFVRRGATELLVGDITVSFTRTMLYYADVTTLSYILAVWLGKVIDAREALVAQTRHELALRSQLARARLGYLHAQLQPHFLFNALGAVSELIFENPAAAIRTFTQLGAVLRAAASHNAAEIPLREEVAGLVPYLEVQRTRFSDWLAIELDIDAAAEDMRVPPLILQPLVENSIRHGLRGRSSRGEVSITARVQGERLLLSVRDNGVGLSGGNGIRRSGVGLSNTEERLRTLYGNDGSLRLFNDELGGAVAEVSIPVRSEVAADIDVDFIPPAGEPVEEKRGFARRHPAVALVAGCLVAAALWTQQSYAYLAISGRLGEKTLVDLLRQDFFMVVAWAAMVPIIASISRRVPIAGRRWLPASFVHLAAVILLTLAHALAVFVHRMGGSDTGILATFRGSAPITLLLYVGVVAYSQRRILEEWLAERQLAALRLNADITEANIAAATMAVAPESLDATLAELERHARDNPLRAEQAIARLGSELRATLEGGFAAPRDDSGSGSARALRGENRVERLAMGA